MSDRFDEMAKKEIEDCDVCCERKTDCKSGECPREHMAGLLRENFRAGAEAMFDQLVEYKLLIPNEDKETAKAITLARILEAQQHGK